MVFKPQNPEILPHFPYQSHFLLPLSSLSPLLYAATFPHREPTSKITIRRRKTSNRSHFFYHLLVSSSYFHISNRNPQTPLKPPQIRLNLRPQTRKFSFFLKFFANSITQTSHKRVDLLDIYTSILVSPPKGTTISIQLPLLLVHCCHCHPTTATAPPLQPYLHLKALVSFQHDVETCLFWRLLKGNVLFNVKQPLLDILGIFSPLEFASSMIVRYNHHPLV